MISSNDMMASNLWRVNSELASPPPFKHGHPTLPSTVRPVSPAQFSLSSNDDNNDISELPYLSTEPIESRANVSMPPPMADPSIDSKINGTLLATLFGDNYRGATSIRSIGFEGTAIPSARKPSRPVLVIDLVSRSDYVEPSTPSPVDSGYGSRPDTPFVDKNGGSKVEEANWSPVDDLSSLSDESISTHEALSDGKYAHMYPGYAKTNGPDQGLAIPRIILSDEDGRVSDAVFDDQCEGWISSPPFAFDEDIDGPYGGLMPSVASDCTEFTVPIPCVRADSKVRSSATGAVLDRAFVSFVRPHGQSTPSNSTSTYRNAHCTPTFVLGCVGEEGEEDAEIVGHEELVAAEATPPVWNEEDGAEERGSAEIRIVCGESSLEAPNLTGLRVVETGVSRLTDADPDTLHKLMSLHVAQATEHTLPVATQASTPENVAEFTQVRFESDEDDECEDCGLYFTAPDDRFSRLIDTICPPQVQPGIVFGLLRTISCTSQELNTAYHVAVEGRSRGPAIAYCDFDCERGYWAGTSGSCIVYPPECAAHGGHGRCDVGAIFHPPTTLSTTSVVDLDGETPDYETHAAEVVGVVPPRPVSSHEDAEGDDLVLHSAEKLHGVEDAKAVPETSTGYDDYMSRFMEDVDLTSCKNVPLGKFGGAFKELRGSTVPEAVDHLMEGLEKTESVFRAAFSSPFKFNSVADKLVPHLNSGELKAQPSREKRVSNGANRHKREYSASGMKAKWSSMLSKFTR